MQEQLFRIFVNKQVKCKKNSSNTDNGSKIVYQEIMEMFTKFGLGHSVNKINSLLDTSLKMTQFFCAFLCKKTKKIYS